MILRVKVINGKKINVGNIEKVEIYSVNTLKNLFRQDYTVEGHVEGHILGYEAEDDRQRDETGYVTAHCKNSKHLFILKRASMKRCDKYIRKVEKRQSFKSWAETYGPGTAITAAMITAISTLIIAIVSLKKCQF